jgi:ribosome-associated protein
MPVSVSGGFEIDDGEIEWKAIRSSGPGGQNVNKVASAVQLRFLLARNTSLSAPVRQRLRRLAGQKLSIDGSILITARGERSQEQNRRDALERLGALIAAALVEPKIRKKTRPTHASRERRIEAKKHRAGTKSARRGSLSQRHLQDIVPQLLRKNELRVGGDAEQRLAEA